MSQILLEVKGLKKYFSIGRGSIIKAVDDVSFFIKKGETLGLVGESGSGKSTVAKTLLRLHRPTAGEVRFEGRDIFGGDKLQSRSLCRRMQMIFQDPYSSLNPRMAVSDIIGEALDIHGLAKGRERKNKIEDYLTRVQLNPEHASRFPHEFSGGQRQCIGIARALAAEPSFMVCDEPVSALDGSIQAQVLNLLKKLQKDLGLTYLFIAHDLSLVRHMSNQVAVMYRGKIVEMAESKVLYTNAIHPYTKALLSAIPVLNPDVENSNLRTILRGDIPGTIDYSGCRFSDRCPLSEDRCFVEEPTFRLIENNHYTACHRI